MSATRYLPDADADPDNYPAVVNVVGSGTLDGEVDRQALAADIPLGDPTYAPDSGDVRIRTDDGSTAIVWRTGSYTVRAGSVQRCRAFHDEFVAAVEHLDARLTRGSRRFGIRNVVMVGYLGEPITLRAAALALGDQSEYEPEQFPGLVWETEGATLLIFGTGRVVSVGTPTVKDAQASIDRARDALGAAGLINTEDDR